MNFIRAPRRNQFAAALIASAVLAPAALAQQFDFSALERDPSPARVGQIIDELARYGRGTHNFHLTYCSSAPGVVVSDRVHKRHPVEITIVLEWQYWDLERVNDAILVTVSFDGLRERLVIPLDALTIFADPSVGVLVQLKEGATAKERCAGAALFV